MDAVKIRCRDLMLGDWIADNNGFRLQITSVGDDYAYATFEGNEGDPWEFDDKDDQPEPIEITKELLEANGWDVCRYKFEEDDIPTSCNKEEKGNCLEWICGTLSICIAYEENSDGVYADILVPCKYIHQLQQALRLAGLTDMANNFKI